MVRRILLSGICILTIAFGMTGCDTVEVGVMDYEKYKNNDSVMGIMTTSVSKEENFSVKAENIENIKVDVGSTTIKVIESNDDKISVSSFGEELKIEESNKSLNIKLENKLTELNDGVEVVIGIPKKWNKNIDINAVVGLVSIGKKDLKSVNVKMVTGVVETGILVDVDNMNVDLGMGSVVLGINKGNNINVKQDVGEQIILVKEFAGEVNSKLKTGEIDIVYGNKMKPKIEGKVKVGSFINGSNGEDEGKIKKGIINAKLNIGELKIDSKIYEDIEKDFIKSKIRLVEEED